ncbi:MAG: hypothetical protein ED557_14915 [Balneola sp.]|nr:MAG: hypothetical protein ED557_14915 [Balneola sp.]
MGQQQIIILLLVFIIAVLGVFLGIQLVGETNLEFTEGEYTQIMLESGELFQATYEKPELFGGASHNWKKANFSNVPCTYGDISDPQNRSCRQEDGNFVIFLTYHGDHMALNGVAHIGGKDKNHLYTRQLLVYADSIVFSTDWIGPS